MTNGYNGNNETNGMFCPECKSLLTFDKNTHITICKKCAKSKNEKRPNKKNLEELVLKFEDVLGDSKSYEFIFTDTIADLRRLNKPENNYVLCRCHPCDEGSVEKAYISLRYFIQKGTIPKNKAVYVSDVPCKRNCVDICKFTLAEKNDLVIKKIERYKDYFKNPLPKTTE